ncbi:MAG: hypothetical protein IKC30_01295 [Rikenellaceae bacterium]|nr:hypothetical protein [Rikenellaceae bacterium]
MNLAELIKFTSWNEYLIFSNEKEVAQKVEKDSDEYLYSYQFLGGGDDEDFEDNVKSFLEEFYYDEMPKYAHRYERIMDDDNGEELYFELKDTYPFTPTEEEIKEISGEDYFCDEVVGNEEYSIVKDSQKFLEEELNEYERELLDRVYEGLTTFREIKELIENNDGDEEMLKKVENVINVIEEIYC